MVHLRQLAAIAVVSVTLCGHANAQDAGLDKGYWVPPTTPQSDEISADADADADAGDGAGSLLTHEALGSGNVGMALSGGVAVLLPFFSLEVGVGLPYGLDIVGRFETVIGIFHYPGVGLRWQPLEIGTWRAGVKSLVTYSFFGINTDQTNFTSTFYLSNEVGISGPVTETSELGFGVGGEIDLFTVDVVDDESNVEGNVRWDATVLRTVFVTALSQDIDGFAQLRARIPTETFEFDAQEFYVIPMLDIGGVWTF